VGTDPTVTRPRVTGVCPGRFSRLRWTTRVFQQLHRPHLLPTRPVLLLSRHPCENRGPVRVRPAIPKVCVLPAIPKVCVLPATHAASARSAGPLRPNERKAPFTAPLASPLDSCLRRNDGGNRPSFVSHRAPARTQEKRTFLMWLGHRPAKLTHAGFSATIFRETGCTRGRGKRISQSTL
jgi:hypothetical protein